MAHKDKKYKWCIYCNNGQGAWGFHWKDGHEEWKNKQGRKPSICFSNPTKNALIYCSYLMTTSEESTEEKPKVGDDSHSNDFISLSHFELLELLPKIVCYPLLIYFYYVMVLMWTWISLESESCW